MDRARQEKGINNNKERNNNVECESDPKRIAKHHVQGERERAEQEPTGEREREREHAKT